jgi:hypothetical protein
MKSHGMTSDLREQSPRRYFVDESVLIGLTIEETFEFETRDSLPALDESGNHVAWHENGVPTTTENAGWSSMANTTRHGGSGWSKPMLTAPWV